jgi:hypothetical protein
MNFLTDVTRNGVHLTEHGNLTLSETSYTIMFNNINLVHGPLIWFYVCRWNSSRRRKIPLEKYKIHRETFA